MDNLVKRIIQKELENHGEPPEKKEKGVDSRLGKLLEKRNQSITQLRKKNQFISNGSEEIPLNKWILQFH